MNGKAALTGGVVVAPIPFPVNHLVAVSNSFTFHGTRSRIVPVRNHLQADSTGMLSRMPRMTSFLPLIIVLASLIVYSVRYRSQRVALWLSVLFGMGMGLLVLRLVAAWT
jgi:hypothetical protein